MFWLHTCLLSRHFGTGIRAVAHAGWNFACPCRCPEPRPCTVAGRSPRLRCALQTFIKRRPCSLYGCLDRSRRGIRICPLKSRCAGSIGRRNTRSIRADCRIDRRLADADRNADAGYFPRRRSRARSRRGCRLSKNRKNYCYPQNNADSTKYFFIHRNLSCV